jgi:formyltetrahydrofolate hydrolase
MLRASLAGEALAIFHSFIPPFSVLPYLQAMEELGRVELGMENGQI